MGHRVCMGGRNSLGLGTLQPWIPVTEDWGQETLGEGQRQPLAIPERR